VTRAIFPTAAIQLEMGKKLSEAKAQKAQNKEIVFLPV